MEEQKKSMELVDTDRVARVGADGEVALRQPTPHEWNRFQEDLYPVRRNKVTNNASKARCDLFDRLVTRIDNIGDNAGPITLDSLERFPARLKAQIVFRMFEGDEEVEIKN